MGGNKKGEFCFRVKEKIIDASIESLRQEGLRFSVDVLANRLRISKKTIYRIFHNKEALAFALYEKGYAKRIEMPVNWCEELGDESRINNKQRFTVC